MRVQLTAQQYTRSKKYVNAHLKIGEELIATDANSMIKLCIELFYIIQNFDE